MLDFGSRMAQKDDHMEDDLFSSVAGEPEPSTQTDVSPEPEIPAEMAPEVVTGSAAAAEPVEPAAAVESENGETSEPENVKTPVRLSFLRKARNHAGDMEKLDTCKILKNARLELGLSLDDVEAETQIRRKYLDALEEGIFDDLPQQVYVLAYLRKLCRLYGIADNDEEIVVKPWRQVTREVPENLPASMIPDEDSENSKILRRLEFALLAGGAIVAIGIIAFLVILAVSFFNRGDTPPPEFDNTTLLELQEKPQLTAPRMEPVRARR